jgi:glycosyltransferase involved in cell wall biosynthesis
MTNMKYVCEGALKGRLMVLVSVIMGAYNHEHYIAEAIKSVLSQTMPDLELIIVDDASSDSTPKIIKSYQQNDSRVKAFFHQKNMGIASTANQCLNNANGQYLTFIGSDDLWVETKLEKQLKILQEHPDWLVWSEGEIINSNGKSTGQTFTGLHLAGKKRKTGNIFREILDDNYIFGQSLMFRKEHLKNQFSTALKYLSDYRFMVDLAFEHDFFFISEPLAKYRIHGNNSIVKDETNWLKDRIMLRQYFLQKYGPNLSRNLKGNLYLKIGNAYSSLGNQDLAKHYYLKALKSNFVDKEAILYLAYVLGDAKGFVGGNLLNLYMKVNSLFEVRTYK